MAFRAASNRRGIIAAPMALSPTEAGARTKTMTAEIPVDRRRAFRIAGALVGLAAVLGASSHANDVLTASDPNDYRPRHPIAIQEADHSVVVFVGHARGGLSAPQRADVIGLAQIWLSEAPGASQ